ncbi:hypothetical protein BO94DRAFT_606936 [Aspergillus sclerotioniger CBS 115572]|uniref:Uncharacterized protein n=1 Tax=Aspergillus sclerotioniger CBS 115572 TaxID=1450535 RepID=A0A317VN25_9EURO|nr:hypothetical protein BO94DRAFT_606936 [Aspergillus sclerotioniger CBS 115572]PWY74487.1 hypothetical protein BO94DRAFT_606936 [Aspergillus sclerotioniger CBS 115572]
MEESPIRLRCIGVIPSEGPAEITAPGAVSPEIRQRLQDSLVSSLLKSCPADLWPGTMYLSNCPFPMLVTRNHLASLASLNKVLVTAIDDIVTRWVDPSANFPARMPLHPVEERLLQWLDDAQHTGIIRPFRECRGSWRPDFLIEEQGGTEDRPEAFRICEINARFCWNGFMMNALGQDALVDTGISGHELVGATDSQSLFDGMHRLYNPRLPLHLLKDQEPGVDIHLYTHYARHLGQQVRFITPADLRLIPCNRSPGNKLCCLVHSRSPIKGDNFQNEAGEILEEVHQIQLELHHHELLDLGYEMLQEISLRCFNDMRTLLLVHDKRMLGVVLEEIDSFVARKVLTPQEASLLERGICETILPGSNQLAQLIERCRLQCGLKDEWLLKPARSGKGEGIVFGRDMTPESWISRLKELICPFMSAGGATYVIQKKVRQAKYDVLLKDATEVQQLPIVGTYHAINGEFLGIGTWRSSPGPVCTVSHGGTWMCSVMQAEL